MSESVLNIRLIRALESKKEDDVIRITKLDEGFQLTFRYGFSNYAKPTLRTIECDARTIIRWLRITIDLLQHDDDPFASIQLDAQMLPSVLILVSRLDRAYDIIIDAVEFQLNNWPEDPMPALVPMRLYADSPPFKPQHPVDETDAEDLIRTRLQQKEDEDEEYTQNLIRECTDTRLEEQEQEDEGYTNYLSTLPEQSQALPIETPA